MWRHVAPRFEDQHRVVLFDHVGAGRSDLAAYDPDRHASLDGYAQDLVEVLRELDLRDVVLVGHSVSAMIAVLASERAPDRVSRLVLVSPSPRYVDDEGYRGGFSAEDVEEMLETLDSNYLGWSSTMAPVIMGHPDRPELSAELEASFCRTDPEMARRFARLMTLSRVVAATKGAPDVRSMTVPGWDGTTSQRSGPTAPGARPTLDLQHGNGPGVSAAAAPLSGDVQPGGRIVRDDPCRDGGPDGLARARASARRHAPCLPQSLSRPGEPVEC